MKMLVVSSVNESEGTRNSDEKKLMHMGDSECTYWLSEVVDVPLQDA